jgi:hypothetical protein
LRISPNDRRQQVKVKLGKRYRDKVTGFEGVATSVTEYLQGCRRAALERLNKAEDALVILSFDEPNLEYVPSESAVKERTRTGGPHDHNSMLDTHR